MSPDHMTNYSELRLVGIRLVTAEKRDWQQGASNKRFIRGVGITAIRLPPPWASRPTILYLVIYGKDLILLS
ncbi:hypothetical protein ANO14919_049140 [Xylariales sp. No.14919]|nr:hypothetical protein ANO14919_049140 [Xylariales sp. No.14919]